MECVKRYEKSLLNVSRKFSDDNEDKDKDFSLSTVRTSFLIALRLSTLIAKQIIKFQKIFVFRKFAEGEK